MASVEELPDRSGHVVIGVDTHKHVHVAAVLDPIGGILATLTIPTDKGGFAQLLQWALTFGQIIAFGIEGTGSYGAGLTSYLRRQGHRVVEVSRADRRMRRLKGKSDTLDAENAARSVLAGLSVFCQVLVGHVAGFFPASWLLHEGVGYSPGFALVA